jgi:hypothetical protein|tara:strand:- start:655 stop:906 length:252 start_codon:yes stop_codon:yes gene_type:complete
MPKKKKETAMIYESPDGGATVYARPIDGKGERVLIEQPNFPDWYLNEVEISEIVDYANEGNKSLQIQLKKLKLMYDLIKDNRW